MSVELHLPDLPEVPLSVGGDAGQPPRRRRHFRWRDALANYLPLLLMTALALGSWWLVKRAPRAPADTVVRPVRAEPDYTMERFSVERFDPQGRLKARIEGRKMMHFPANDQIEISDVRIVAFNLRGRPTVATAQRAIAQGDGSRIDLLGQAEITGQADGGQAVRMRAQSMRLEIDAQRVSTDSAVIVEMGSHRVQADGLDYDHPSQLLQLKGRMRAVLAAKEAP